MTRQANRNQGTVIIETLEMVSAGKTISLVPYTNRIDIYESILSPGIIGEILIADATGLFSTFTDGKLKIEFTTYEDAPPIKYELRIIKKEHLASPANGKGVIYKLTAVSEETYLASNIRNLPLVRSKDVLVEEPVIAMLQALKSEKEFFTEKTSGLHSVSSANMTPFEFIDKMRKIAVSSKYKASAFVFFENKYGFNFKCLETLVEEGLKAIGDKIYVYHNLADLDVEGTQWRNIIAAKQLQVGNELVAGLIGGNKNVSTQFDVVTGEFVKYDYDATSSFESISMNDNSVWIDTERLSEFQDNGKQAVTIYDSSSDKHFVAEKDNYLPYYLAKFLTVVQHITVYGDSTLTVGDLITVHFPERTGLTGDVELDQNLAGNYMVCKCRHIVQFDGDGPKFYQALEIVKDGVGGSMPSMAR